MNKQNETTLINGVGPLYDLQVDFPLPNKVWVEYVQKDGKRVYEVMSIDDAVARDDPEGTMIVKVSATLLRELIANKEK